MTQPNQYVVGVDIGGTKIMAGVVDREGKIYGTAKTKTQSAGGFENSFKRITNCVKEAIQAANMTQDDIFALGVGAPGPLDLVNGVVIDTPNLRWKNVPLRDAFKNEFKVPVKIDNDVNTGVLGEYIFGVGKGTEDLIGLFIGTGIGGGIIINGKLLHGFNQNAGELGHILVNPKGPRCNCGVKGHLEAYASKTGIENTIRRGLEKGKNSVLASKLNKAKAPLTSSQLADAYFKGDRLVVKAVERSAKYLGFAISSLLNIFNPEMVILGGGLVTALDESYIEKITQIAFRNAFPIASKNVRIVPAELGDHSVILGASRLAYEALDA
jgi:glucokinase